MNLTPKPLFRIVLLYLAGLLLAASVVKAEKPKPTFITIGTGSRMGIYYPVGSAISTLVNRYRPINNLRCSVESTRGSVYNLNTMHFGELELCISQSDQIIDAYRGESSFTKREPFLTLRTLFSLYMEPLTFVTRKNESINVSNLQRKLIYMGQPDSGHRATVTSFLKQLGVNRYDIHEPEGLIDMDPTKALQNLCARELDAVLLVVGHPYQPLRDATNNCDLAIMPATGAKVDQLVRTHPAYHYCFIPGSLYAGNPTPIKSVGVIATLVSTSTVDPEIIYQVVKAVFEQLEQLKKAHPRLKHLNQKEMLTKLAVPLHEGARRYYIETGLLEAGTLK